MSQLELFDADLKLMPWRISLPIVRDTARMLIEAPEDEAAERWKITLRKLATSFERAGMPKRLAREHLINFRDAVENAMQALGGPDGHPGAQDDLATSEAI